MEDKAIKERQSKDANAQTERQIHRETQLINEFVFLQASDGRCRCTIGYQPTSNGDACVHKLYDVCRDGKLRTQHGDCLDRHQLSLHCRQRVRPCVITSHTHMGTVKVEQR